MLRAIKRVPELLAEVGITQTIRRGYHWAHFQTLGRLIGLPQVVNELGIVQTMDMLKQWMTGQQTLTVYPRSLSVPVYIRRNDSDYYVFRDAIVLRDSDPPLPRKPRFIIDGGANVGYTTLVYSQRYPEATIVAIEPDRHTAELLRKQCRELPNVHVIESAIWGTNSKLELLTKPGASWVSQVREADAATSQVVQAVTIPDLMTQFNVDFVDLLKLDVEGAEREIFSAKDTTWLRRVGVLVIELHGSAAHDIVHRALASYPFELSQRGEKLVCTQNGSSHP